jgi:hypothetical protein
MSHEEKALRNKYGNNLDSNALSLQTSNMATPLKLRSNVGSKIQK